MKNITIILIILALNKMFSQSNLDNKQVRIDFGISLINKKQIISVKKINDNEKIQGIYLGQIKTKQNKIYYITGLSYLFNLKNSPTAESHIFIYDKRKRLIGYYYLSYLYELPVKITKNKLYFKNKVCKETSIVDFENGIPKSINLKCNDENNYYEFQK